MTSFRPLESIKCPLESIKCPLESIKWMASVVFIAIFSCLTFQASGYAQSIGAFSGFKSGNNTPMQIEADHLKVYDSKAVAVFQGNVKVVQGNSLLKADKLKVFYENTGKGRKGKKSSRQGNSIKRLEVFGTVYVRSGENEATSDRGSFQMNTEDVELVGNVVLTEGKSIMTGCRFRANLKTGIVTMESRCGNEKGRVKILFEPKSRPKK